MSGMPPSCKSIMLCCVNDVNDQQTNAYIDMTMLQTAQFLIEPDMSVCGAY